MRIVLFLKGGIVLKRVFCLLLVLLFALSLCVPAFADSEALFCRKCGKPIPTDSNFCPYCGAAVTVDASGAKNATASPRSDTPTVTVPTVPAATQSAALSSGGRLDYSTILNRVRVTKSPTSESVPYGGSCTFIAHAANATSVTWIITTSDGSISAPAYEAANSISGLYVSGANTDTLKLSGIPSWMNGCMVQACFTGEGGPVYTEAARIWTYQPQSSSSDEGGMLWWWPYRYLAWWWLHPDPGPHPGPGPRPDPHPAGDTNVYQIGHESQLYPWTSWFDPYGRPIPQDPDHDFILDGSDKATENRDFTPIAEGGGQTSGGNTAYLFGMQGNDYDVLVVEKDDNSAFDLDYLRRLWEFYYNNQNTTGSGSTTTPDSGDGDTTDPGSGNTDPDNGSGGGGNTTPGNGNTDPGNGSGGGGNTNSVVSDFVEDIDNNEATADDFLNNNSSSNDKPQMQSEWVDF